MRNFSQSLVALLALFAGTMSLIGGESAAQGFPSKPIRFVVPYGSVGVPDLIARVIAKRLGENAGWKVFVDNRPGAGGIIAAELVLNAPADGYTLLVADTGHVAINPALYPKLPYDPLRDFAPVTLALSTPLFLVVNASLPVNSVKQLIDYAKAKPGIPFGSSGNGSVHQLGMELFKLLAGVDMTHIPYKGVAQSVPALITGDTKAALLTVSTVGPHVKSGKVRIIAVATAKRTPLMPDIPTIAEAGLPGYEIKLEIGFLAPAGTPREVIEKLNGEIVKVLAAPDIAQQLTTLGLDPVGTTPDQYAEIMREDIRKFGKLVKDTGARVD